MHRGRRARHTASPRHAQATQQIGADARATTDGCAPTAPKADNTTPVHMYAQAHISLVSAVLHPQLDCATSACAPAAAGGKVEPAVREPAHAVGHGRQKLLDGHLHAAQLVVRLQKVAVLDLGPGIWGWVGGSVCLGVPFWGIRVSVGWAWLGCLEVRGEWLSVCKGAASARGDVRAAGSPSTAATGQLRANHVVPNTTPNPSAP